MILHTLAEAFQGEYDVGGSHTAHVSQAKEALVKSEEQEGDIEEILLAYKESRQLRVEQRLNCDHEYRVCNDNISCQPNVDCESREWHEWNGCSATCDGLRHRSRHIALQGSGHGKFCTGVADEVQNCNSSSACEREAKVDCQWSEWNSWSSCSVTCGRGQYNRSRFEKGHWTGACPITGKQVPRDGEVAKTSFFVHFGRDHSHQITLARV